MKPAKKPSLSVILGMGSKSPAGDPETDMDGKTEAIRQLMEALKTDDAEGASAALSAFVDLQMSEEDEDEADEEETQGEDEEEGDY